MSSENRRRVQDRRSAGRLVDVTRLEHENLCGQVDQLLRTVGRLESQLSRVQERMTLLEQRRIESAT